MRHISNKKGKCAHSFKERALDAKQIINFFCLSHLPARELSNWIVKLYECTAHKIGVNLRDTVDVKNMTISETRRSKL